MIRYNLSQLFVTFLRAVSESLEMFWPCHKTGRFNVPIWIYPSALSFTTVVSMSLYIIFQTKLFLYLAWSESEVRRQALVLRLTRLGLHTAHWALLHKWVGSPGRLRAFLCSLAPLFHFTSLHFSLFSALRSITVMSAGLLRGVWGTIHLQFMRLCVGGECVCSVQTLMLEQMRECVCVCLCGGTCGHKDEAFGALSL